MKLGKGVVGNLAPGKVRGMPASGEGQEREKGEERKATPSAATAKLSSSNS
jgi:hypothetical protein